MSKGTNALLRKGAIALTGIEDILSEYGWDAEERNKASCHLPSRCWKNAVLEALPLRPAHVPGRAGRQNEAAAVPTESPVAEAAAVRLIEETGSTSYVKKPVQ